MQYQPSYTPGSWGATTDSGSYKSIEERYGLVIKVRSPFSSLQSGGAARQGSELGGLQSVNRVEGGSFGQRPTERASERTPSGYLTAVETARNFPSFYRDSQQYLQSLGLAPRDQPSQVESLPPWRPPFREEKFVQTGTTLPAQVAQGVQTSVIGLPREGEVLGVGNRPQTFQVFERREGGQLPSGGREADRVVPPGQREIEIVPAGREVPQVFPSGRNEIEFSPAGREEVQKVLPANQIGAPSVPKGQEGDRTPEVLRVPAGSPEPITPLAHQLTSIDKRKQVPESCGEELPEEELCIEGVGVYKGGVKQGEMNGKGRLFDPEGVLLYEGWFLGNEFEGVGTLHFSASGSIETRDSAFEDLEACGDCVERFEGTFHRSLLEGLGLMRFKGGQAEFFGEFKAGKADGLGIWTHGDLKVAGIWRDNKFVRRV